ncbi:MAG: DUF669 domain-containing protein [Ottowia sp.]|nr:DUF669 domain-containing protein [Ottowia sp.]
MSNLEFDATTIEPSATLDALPSNTYPVKIKWTERKATKKGDGELLQIQLEVIDGEFKGRSVFDRLNLWNPNSQAVDIAQRSLSAICHAINLLKVKNHEELRGKKLMAKIVYKPAEGNYSEGNDVKGYSKLDGGDAEPEVESAPTAAPRPAWAAKK